MIIKIALGLLGFAITFLMAADLLAHFALYSLANLITRGGDGLLLASLAIWLLLILKLLAKTIAQQFAFYFSKGQQAQRQWLFTLIQADNLQRLFHSQKKQLAYFQAFKRRRLMAKDNAKQSRLLAKVLQKQLAQLPLKEAELAAYQQQLNQARRSHNISQLIELQGKISQTLL